MTGNDPLDSVKLDDPKSYQQEVVEAIPIAGGAYKTFQNGAEAVGDGDITTSEVRGFAVEAGGFVQSCAGAVSGFATDPIGWLAGKGLDFLIAVVQPLQDLIHMVSGDGPALADAAGHFGAIGGNISDFADKFAEDSAKALAEWEGGAAEAAAVKFAEFSKGIRGVAGEAGNIAQLLQISSMVMTVIEEFLKALLTELVTWLIMIWTPALAAAVSTAGASTAAASSATAVRAAQTGTRATRQVSRLRTLLDKLKDLLSRLKTWMSELRTNFRNVMDAKKTQSSLAGLEVNSAAQAGQRTSWSTRLNSADDGMVGKRVTKGFGRSMHEQGRDSITSHVTESAKVSGVYDNVGKAQKAGATGEDRPTEQTSDQLDF